MSFFKSKPRTAQQKAQWAKTRVILRALVLVFLVFYVIVPMLNPDDEMAEEVTPMFRYITAAGFSVAVIALGVVTVIEYIRGKKAGIFDAKAYTDDEGIDTGLTTSSSEDSSDAPDDEEEPGYEEYEYEDDEYEDDEYEDDEYEEDDNEDDEYEEDDNEDDNEN